MSRLIQVMRQVLVYLSTSSLGIQTFDRTFKETFYTSVLFLKTDRRRTNLISQGFFSIHRLYTFMKKNFEGALSDFSLVYFRHTQYALHIERDEPQIYSQLSRSFTARGFSFKGSHQGIRLIS